MALSSFKQAGLANTNTKFTGNADFSNTVTGSGSGYKYVSFNASGTLTVTKDGLARILVVGGGGGGYQNQTDSGDFAGGGGGAVREFESFYLLVGNYTVTIGAAQNNTTFTPVSLAMNPIISYKGRNAGYRSGGGSGMGWDFFGWSGYVTGPGGGAGGPATSTETGPGITSSITGSSLTYGIGGRGYRGSVTPQTANSGNGGNLDSSGNSGVIIVRVAV